MQLHQKGYPIPKQKVCTDLFSWVLPLTRPTVPPGHCYCVLLPILSSWFLLLHSSYWTSHLFFVLSSSQTSSHPVKLLPNYQLSFCMNIELPLAKDSYQNNIKAFGQAMDQLPLHQMPSLRQISSRQRQWYMMNPVSSMYKLVFSREFCMRVSLFEGEDTVCEPLHHTISHSDIFWGSK